MLGLAAQWLGVNQTQANSVAPILISEEQGRHKSTFCRMLMPPQLARYYSDNLKLTAQGNPERLLAEMGLLNMDEFDKFGAQKMPLLKNLMQMSSLNICKAYQKNFRSLPRIASFIGTGLTYCAIRQAAADSSALKRSMILTVPELNIHKSTPN